MRSKKWEFLIIHETPLKERSSLQMLHSADGGGNSFAISHN